MPVLPFRKKRVRISKKITTKVIEEQEIPGTPKMSVGLESPTEKTISPTESEAEDEVIERGKESGWGIIRKVTKTISAFGFW